MLGHVGSGFNGSKTMTSPIAANARIVAELRERLTTFGWTEEEMQDTLEGATDLPEQLARLARVIVRTEAFAEAMKDIIRDNQARKAQLEFRAEKLRGLVAWTLSETGMKKIPPDALPDLTVTVREGQPPLIIPDDDAVPHMFCHVKYLPDRKEIRAALTSGGLEADWAHLGNPMPSLTIRTK
jgi:hypothetical protein